MRFDARLTGRPAIEGALALPSLLTLAGCETPPSGIPTAQSIRGLKPSGRVTMTQAFVAGASVGGGTLTFGGRAYSFALIGSLIGLGALNTLQASGEVYRLKDVSQFPVPIFRARAASRSPRPQRANYGSRTGMASSCA